MQSFDTKKDPAATSEPSNEDLTVAATHELPAGACARAQLSDGGEVAVCNVDGEYYAIDNFCPHRGAPLSEGSLTGSIIECGLHGWQFDVRTGECLTVPERLKTYNVTTDEGLIKIKLS